MKFAPKSESEIMADMLLPAGTYPFEVLMASNEISRSGNEMIKLKLAVFSDTGDTVHVYDYLLEKLAYKLRHFAATTGLLGKYEKGELDAMDCVAKAGYCKIAIDPGTERYPAKNIVKDYIEMETGKDPARVAAPIQIQIPSQLPMKNHRNLVSESLAEPRRKPVVAAVAAAVGMDDDIPF